MKSMDCMHWVHIKNLGGDQNLELLTTGFLITLELLCNVKSYCSNV